MLGLIITSVGKWLTHHEVQKTAGWGVDRHLRCICLTTV